MLVKDVNIYIIFSNTDGLFFLSLLFFVKFYVFINTLFNTHYSILQSIFTQSILFIGSFYYLSLYHVNEGYVHVDNYELIVCGLEAFAVLAENQFFTVFLVEGEA